MSMELLWTILGVAVALIGGLATTVISLAQQARQNRSRYWEEVIAWARIVEDDREQPIARALAQQALISRGLTAEYLKAMLRNQSAVDKLFDPLPYSAAQVAEVEEALKRPMEVDEDLAMLTQAARQILGRLRSLDDQMGRGSADRRIRIAFMGMVFALTFAVLVVAAVQAARG